MAKNDYSKKYSTWMTLTLSIALLSSCASYRPILDEDEAYTSVGEGRAERDIDTCMSKADTYLKKHNSERMGKQAGRGAVGGAVLGGALGLVMGGSVASTAVGAGVGAAGGAAAGAGGVAMKDNLSPDEIKQNYVERCLGRKHYTVLGWK